MDEEEDGEKEKAEGERTPKNLSTTTPDKTASKTSPSGSKPAPTIQSYGANRKKFKRNSKPVGFIFKNSAETLQQGALHSHTAIVINDDDDDEEDDEDYEEGVEEVGEDMDTDDDDDEDDSDDDEDDDEDDSEDDDEDDDAEDQEDDDDDDVQIIE